MFSTQDITKMHKHLEQEYSGVTYSAIFLIDVLLLPRLPLRLFVTSVCSLI
jgi:hypothetical protein